MSDVLASRRRTRAILVGALKFGLGVVLLAALVTTLAPSWAQIRATVALDWRFVGVALFGTAAATAVTSARWRTLAELMGGARLPYAIYFHYLALTRLVGQFTSVALMDAVGRGVAVSAVTPSGPKVGQHLGALVVERLLDLLLPIAALGWAVASVQGWLPGSPWVSLAILALVFLGATIPLLDPMARVVGRAFAKVQRWRGKQTTVTPLPAPPPLAMRVAVLSLARYAAVVLQYWGTGALAGLSIDALAMSYATPVSQLTAFIGVTPGGIGIQDAGWAGALTWLGHSGPVIAAYILVTRVTIIANFGLLSLLSRPFVSQPAAR